MKRISLLLFGAMIALGVRAQQLYVKSDWKLDSVITTSQDGQLLIRMVCTYDSQDLLLRVDGQEMNGGILYDTKSLHTYNDQGMTASQELYMGLNGEWNMLSKSEVKEYDPSNGMPRVIESVGPQEQNPLGGSVTSRTEITKWHGNLFEEEEVYVWLGGAWNHGSSVKATYDANDLMVKMVTIIGMMGYEYESVVDYEYDSHGYVTKETRTSLGTTSTLTYVNEYDGDDNLSKVTLDNEGQISITRYYWSRKGASAISGVKTNESASQWFSLSGHRLAGKPAKQGIYIRDGKKFIVK